jgi:hypothetical protein
VLTKGDGNGRCVVCVLAAGVIASTVLCSAALGQDSNGNAASTGSSLPNIYLDYRTTFSALPPNVLLFGFRGITSISVAASASQSVALDFPLTVDLTDSLSVWGGITSSTSRTDTTSWSSMTLNSWNVGFQADIYQQNGGSIPTVTIQSTLTQTVPQGPLVATSLNTIAELGYALNEDETRGLLAGVQLTNVFIDSPFANVKPNVVGYVGGYYQWDNNWKLTGRVGVQSFNGAQLLDLQLRPFTQPIVRLDLDRMDDNDNRLFGITAEIAWTPKPAYQLTVRTPLYAVKN